MPDKRKRPISWLQDAPSKDNLAGGLTSEELGLLGSDVVRTYELDVSNRSDWDKISESALKLAKQVKESKSFPWEGASSVKHPLITVSCIQFAARAYPEIVKGDQIVKCHITGDDFRPRKPAVPSMPPAAPALAGPGPGGPAPPVPMAGPSPESGMGMPPEMMQQMAAMQAQTQAGPNPKRERADRVALHMNYQLTQEMVEWDPDMDRLLHILPVLGQVFKKTYYSVTKKRNVSELVLPTDCYVNKKGKSIEDARRVTHRLWFYENDIWEKVRSGLWAEIDDLGPPPEADSNDTDAPHEFLEQHCFKDLDGDGYKEPYVVTVHKATEKVVRVVARWQPEGLKTTGTKVDCILPDTYFTHYGFIPNPDGSLNYLGFGQLLEPINQSVNSILNQLIDAGTLSNAAGGFLGRGVKIRGGQYRFSPFEWKNVDVQGPTLRDNMIPLPVRDPSPVLFQLLGFLVQAGKDISSVQDILSGDAKLAGTMPVGTIMALVEQGLKVFTAIYKRIYRSLREEFMKLYKLNAFFVDPRVPFELAGQEFPVGDPNFKPDYLMEDLTVVPVADPNLSSDMQRMLKAQALAGLSGRPGLDEIEITRSLVHAIKPENERDILMTDGQLAGTEPTKFKKPPDPNMIKAQANAQLLQARAMEVGLRLQMDLQRYNLEMEEALSKIELNRSTALLNIAKAKSEGDEDQLAAYKHVIDQIANEAKLDLEMLKMKAQGAGMGGQGAPKKIPGRQGGGPVAAGNPTS